MKPPTTGYCLPPAEIVEIVDQPPEPSLSFSPDRKKVAKPWQNRRLTVLADQILASVQDTTAVFLIYVGHATLQTTAPAPNF